MTTAAATTPRRTPLDVDRILDAALALVRTEGADAFSMRRLASTLGVTPMALYKWFDDRDALLDALGDRVFGSFRLPDDIDAPWIDRMLLVAEAMRRELLAGRAILPLVGGRRRTDILLARSADRVLSLLAEVGYGPDEAVERFRSFHWSIVGFVFTIDAGPPLPSNDGEGSRTRELAAIVELLGREEVPHLAASSERFGPVDLDRLFRSTMRSLVRGIAADAPDRATAEAGISPRGTPRGRRVPRR